jgi:predicted metal-dependent enzyme (double-stranded beta helix superfamily)
LAGARGDEAAGLTLEDFIHLMSGQDPEALTHAQLLDHVGRLRLSDELVERRTRFARDEYARNLVCRTPEFELLVLCWRPGQQSTIHDHDGALNAIKVYRGELTSRLYAPASGAPPRAAGPVKLLEEQRVRALDGLAGIDRDGIHQLANRSSEDLVTIHVYSPALMQLTVYSEDAPATQLRQLRYTPLHDLG